MSMRFFRQEYWSGLPFPPSEDLPNTGIQPMSPALQVDSFPPEPSTEGTTSYADPWRRKLSQSVQSLSHVRLFATPWTAARQASLLITNSRSLLKLMSIESGMPSNHLILCHPLPLLPSIFLSFRVFSSELALRIMWPKDWNFSLSISPSNEYSGLISFRIDWFDLLAVHGDSRVFSSIMVQKYQFFGPQPFLWSNPHIHTWLLEKP